MAGNTQAQGKHKADIEKVLVGIGQNWSALLSLKGLEVAGQLHWTPLWNLYTRGLIVFIDLPNSFQIGF